MMRMDIPALFAAFALGAHAQGPQQGPGLRISDVVNLTLERQPQLAEDSLDLEKARFQIDLLKRKVVLPKMEVQVGFAPAPGFRYVVDTTGGKLDSTRKYSWWPLGPTFGTDITVAQPLNVGKLRAGMNAARAGVRVAVAELESHRQEQVKKSLEYLFGFQFATRMLDMVEDAKIRLDSVQEVLQKKLDDDEDGVTQTDLYQIKIGRYELEKSIQEARLGKQRAREGLAFALGLPSGDSLKLRDSLLQPLPDLPALDTLIAGFSHPDLRRLESGLEAKRALVDVERANLGPDIFVFGKFSYTKAWVANRNEQNQDVLITDPLNTVSGMFGLGFTWHLNFWSQLGEVRRAELDWQQLRRKEAYARRGLQAMMKDAWLRYQAMGERQKSAERARDASESWLKTVGQQADIDPSKSKDLIAPYKTWLDFENRYWDAVHERNKLALEVLVGTGTILTFPPLVGP